MSCEASQERVSRLIDADLEESGQVALFRHLEGCPDCRLFFDSMIRSRKAMKRDQQVLTLTADGVLPHQGPLPMKLRPSEDGSHRLLRHPPTEDASRSPGCRSGEGARRGLRILSGRWRMPAPVVVGVAVILLVAGALVGARVSALSGGAGAEARAGKRTGPAVVVICSLPEVQVLGTAARL